MRNLQIPYFTVTLTFSLKLLLDYFANERIELSKLMICEKTKAKILGFLELFLSYFLAFSKSKNIIKETAVLQNMH